MLFICGCGEQRSGTLETANSPEMDLFLQRQEHFILLSRLCQNR